MRERVKSGFLARKPHPWLVHCVPKGSEARKRSLKVCPLGEKTVRPIPPPPLHPQQRDFYLL